MLTFVCQEQFNNFVQIAQIEKILEKVLTIGLMCGIIYIGDEGERTNHFQNIPVERLHILEKYLYIAPKIRILKVTIWRQNFALYGKIF